MSTFKEILYKDEDYDIFDSEKEVLSSVASGQKVGLYRLEGVYEVKNSLVPVKNAVKSSGGKKS